MTRDCVGRARDEKPIEPLIAEYRLLADFAALPTQERNT
jgi:hypothetical protein